MHMVFAGDIAWADDREDTETPPWDILCFQYLSALSLKADLQVSPVSNYHYPFW